MKTTGGQKSLLKHLLESATFDPAQHCAPVAEFARIQMRTSSLKTHSKRFPLGGPAFDRRTRVALEVRARVNRQGF
jgi:hypothetical protein